MLRSACITVLLAIGACAVIGLGTFGAVEVISHVTEESAPVEAKVLIALLAIVVFGLRMLNR